VIKVSTTLREMDKVELVNLERLAYILKGLSAAELETLELLLDEDAYESMNQSLKELGEGKGIPIDEW
jgi:SpoVK/Ycf46/Vps4 family AAA+-type ATPase